MIFMLGVFSLKPAGEPPSPRAAHAAAAVGTMVVFQVIVRIGINKGDWDSSSWLV